MPFSAKFSQPHKAITALLAILLTGVLCWNSQLIINNFRTRPIDLHGLPGYPKYLTRAPKIDAKELISQSWTAVGDDDGTIPHIIHQSWENSNIPAKWATWSDSWRVKHPDWKFVLWTNEDNRALVEARAPWFLDTYDALPGEIRRADVMRNFYMLFFGG
jgi:mannosyltransferase OCH1-like enzyme